jgi:hypothetical protein
LGVTFFIPSYKENGYLYTNLGFGYHKIKNLRRNIYLQGNSDISLTDLMAKNLNNRDIFENDLSDINAYDNIRLDWLSILGYDAYLINPLYDENGVHHGQWNSILGENEQVIPKYSATESTDIEEYNFTYSGNINDVFYFGTGISLQHFSYKIESAYSEFFQNHGDNFDLKNQLTTNGNGVNLKIGAIVRATKFLRFGLSFQTPTWYGLRNWHFGELEYSQNASAVSTPEADYTYQFGTPLKAQASVGFILGKKAAVNIDYQFSGKKYTLSDDYSRTDIDPNNDAKYTHAVKLGAEIRLGKYYKIRGGGAFFSAPVKQNAFKYFPNYTTRTDMEYFVPKNTYYGTCGFGYAQNSFSIDLAYAYQLQNQDFFAADIFRPTADFSGNSANIRSHSHNIILTFAMRY